MAQDNLHAVIFATSFVEFQAIREFLSDCQSGYFPDSQTIHYRPSNAYDQGIFRTNDNQIWEIGLVEIGDSYLEAGALAERVLSFFTPQVILFIGVASGIQDVAAGDVVASTKIYSYEFAATKEKIEPRPTISLGSWSLLAKARAEVQKLKPVWYQQLPDYPDPPPRAWIGSIVAGEKLVASSKSSVHQFLIQNYSDALAVEIEGSGFLKIIEAVQQRQNSFLGIAICGIADLIDNENGSRNQELEVVRQEQAARHASAFAFQLLADFNSKSGIVVVHLPSTEPQVVHIGDLSTSGQLSVQRQRLTSRCFTEPDINLDLMLIPGGTFLMGSPSDELDRYDDEGPQHEVMVSTFLMGRYPVTQAQWRYIAAQPSVNRRLDLDPSNFKGTTLPVEQVSWEDAVEFCDRISRLTGHTYRLPTEAEWEYACRAGTTTPFHFGETITTDLANYRGTDDESVGWSGNYGNGPKGVYRAKTTSVEQFQVANAFGLCDMHGNVWEWCLDDWHDNYEGAPTDGSAWIAGGNSDRRVIRGGSWNNDPRLCRSACRDNYILDYRNNFIGFRVICEARGL